MIIRTLVNFKELLRLEKKYPWPRPGSCYECGGRIWGHGYVRRFFMQAPNGCWVKCYRCPDCGCVITMRPVGYWSRFLNDIETIQQGLRFQNENEYWPPGVKRQTGGHWLRALGKQVLKFSGLTTKIFPKGFDELIRHGWVPVSRSKNGVAIPQVC